MILKESHQLNAARRIRGSNVPEPNVRQLAKEIAAAVVGAGAKKPEARSETFSRRVRD